MDHETLFMHVLELREYAMDSIELLTGNRVNMGWNVVGGVRMDADERHFKPILENLEKKSKLTKLILRKLRNKNINVHNKQNKIDKKGHDICHDLSLFTTILS